MNKMTVKRLWVYGGPIVDEHAMFTEEQTNFLKQLCLACTATVGTDDDGSLKIFGDPTESAIVHLALDKGIDYTTLQATHKR